MKEALNLRRLHGMNILTSPLCDRPRFTLAENVPVTPEFRTEFNQWAHEFFGVERRAFIIRGNVLVMSAETLANLEAGGQL